MCWINSTSAHIIMAKKDQAKQGAIERTVPGQDTCVDCVFLSSTAFASLSSCGVVSGMKFVLALSHPPSSSLSPSSLTPQKRTLEQGTTLLIFVHCGVRVSGYRLSTVVSWYKCQCLCLACVCKHISRIQSLVIFQGFK